MQAKKRIVSRSENVYQPSEYVKLSHPLWSKNATIYEVNIRQYTPEGTFLAFAKHLPRLKALGIDILWLMPIHPIGEKNRKGSLGSFYAVKNYLDVNPAFGSLADFKALVNQIHKLGMHIIIDWVANHSAWDNPLAKEHPEWYSKTTDGNFKPTPWYDWDDIIDFDYSQTALRKYMTQAMCYWVQETNIDGYRCDAAGFVPIDFWENVRSELDAIKPVFMLAEWESRDLHKKAFDMTYAWSLWDKMRVAAQGKELAPLIEYLAHDANAFPKNAFRMTFTDNHDKNAWEGNSFANFGDSLVAAIVLSAVVNGMPLVYSGQEAGLNRSLAFFEKDTIEWKTHEHAQLYQKLFALKHQNKALWNGAWGGEMIRIFNNQSDKILSFIRQKDGDSVLSIFNFSAEETKVNLQTENYAGSYIDWFTHKKITVDKTNSFTLKAWSFLLLTKKQA